MRAEDESQMNIEDDDAVIEDDSVFSNRRGMLAKPKNMIDREPEREPDFSYREKKAQ